MNLKDSQIVSSTIVEKMAHTCLRIEVAGSIRRREEYPGDIDIVLIPSADRPALNFGQKEPPHPNLFERLLWTLEQGRRIEKLAGGPKYKRYTLDASSWGISSAIPIPVKLQITVATPENWAYWLLVRTGPTNFSRWIVDGALPQDIHYADFHLWTSKPNPIDDLPENKNKPAGRIETPEEIDWLTACGLPWMEPWERKPDRRK